MHGMHTRRVNTNYTIVTRERRVYGLDSKRGGEERKRGERKRKRGRERERRARSEYSSGRKAGFIHPIQCDTFLNPTQMNSQHTPLTPTHKKLERFPHVQRPTNPTRHVKTPTVDSADISGCQPMCPGDVPVPNTDIRISRRRYVDIWKALLGDSLPGCH
eukprot:681820-Amorphochlora_amoeboformis.AAC.1